MSIGTDTDAASLEGMMTVDVALGPKILDNKIKYHLCYAYTVIVYINSH